MSEDVTSGKAVLVRVVEMLGKLISRLEAMDAEKRFENENENENERLSRRRPPPSPGK